MYSIILPDCFFFEIANKLSILKHKVDQKTFMMPTGGINNPTRFFITGIVLNDKN